MVNFKTLTSSVKSPVQAFTVWIPSFMAVFQVPNVFVRLNDFFSQNFFNVVIVFK